MYVSPHGFSLLLPLSNTHAPINLRKKYLSFFYLLNLLTSSCSLKNIRPFRKGQILLIMLKHELLFSLGPVFHAFSYYLVGQNIALLEALRCKAIEADS